MTEFDEDWFRTADERYGAIRTVSGVAITVFALLILFLAIAELIHQTPDPKPVRTVTVVTESFPSIAPKADKIVAQPDSDSLKIVKTVPVVPLWRPEVSNPRFEPLPAPVIAQTEFPSLPKPKVDPDKPQPRGDVCVRHGGHRETTPGKRGGWHCAFPKKS